MNKVKISQPVGSEDLAMAFVSQVSSAKKVSA
jgi:hypothetical protein